MKEQLFIYIPMLDSIFEIIEVISMNEIVVENDDVKITLKFKDWYTSSIDCLVLY